MSGQYTITAGDRTSSAIETDNTVVSVGLNSSNQIATGTWGDIVSIFAGNTHTVGLKSDGTVVGTGDNDYGQIDVGTWTDITAIATGGNHTVGLKSDGTVVAVGSSTENRTAVSGWTGIIKIGCGIYSTIGIKADGTAVYTGRTTDGENGIGAWNSLIAATAGYFHTVGLKGDGTVVAVGSDTYGQVSGVSSWTDIVGIAANAMHTVGLKSDGTLVGCGYESTTVKQVTFTGITDTVQVSTSPSHTVGLKSDGTVWAVGSNNSSQSSGVSTWTGILIPEDGEEEVVELIAEGEFFTLTLTGTTDVLLPISSFLARLRSAKRSYLQVVVPYTSEHADYISARTTGDMVLKYKSVGDDEITVVAVALDSIQISLGVSSSNINLTGWRQSTNSSPVTHSGLSAISVQTGDTSDIIIMPGYNPLIKPADTVEASGVSFVAGLVTVQANAARHGIDIRTTLSASTE